MTTWIHSPASPFTLGNSFCGTSTRYPSLGCRSSPISPFRNFSIFGSLILVWMCRSGLDFPPSEGAPEIWRDCIMVFPKILSSRATSDQSKYCLVEVAPKPVLVDCATVISTVCAEVAGFVVRACLISRVTVARPMAFLRTQLIPCYACY